MNGEELVKWGPLVVSVISLLIAGLGHFLKTRETSSEVETNYFEQMEKVNKDLRAEIERRDKQIAAQSLEISELKAEVHRLEVEVLRQRNELFEMFIKQNRQTPQAPGGG